MTAVEHQTVVGDLDALTWVVVAELDRLPIDRGVAAMVGSVQIALFRLADGGVYAVDHLDPFSQVHVMARGLVGDAQGEPKVVSPIYKQSFSLRDGRCLSDATVRLNTYPVEIIDELITIGVPNRLLVESATPR
jgi:nitrite reductase (NADH) small subunit